MLFAARVKRRFYHKATFIQRCRAVHIGKRAAHFLGKEIRMRDSPPSRESSVIVIAWRVWLLHSDVVVFVHALDTQSRRSLAAS